MKAQSCTNEYDGAILWGCRTRGISTFTILYSNPESSQNRFFSVSSPFASAQHATDIPWHSDPNREDGENGDGRGASRSLMRQIPPELPDLRIDLILIATQVTRKVEHHKIPIVRHVKQGSPLPPPVGSG